jgi:hypothetical protein
LVFLLVLVPLHRGNARSGCHHPGDRRVPRFALQVEDRVVAGQAL